MPNINLNLKKSLFVPKFYPLLTDYSKRWEVYMGSAGSAKSYFITQKLIVRACREKIKIMVCRRYASTIRHTCFALFKDILTKWKLYPAYVKVRETDFNIKFPNGSEIIFTGLDEETKLLSLAGIGVIFIEEVYEVEKSKVEQLNLRLRGSTPNQQIIMQLLQTAEEGMHINLIVMETQMNYGDVAAEMLMLEVQGIVKAYPGGVYRVVR
jgi:phage terminase large subunit